MNIIIKQLLGGECLLQVTPKTKILELKQQIAAKLKVPPEDQKLLLLGRALNDDNAVESYPSIKSGTKLNLVVKKPDGFEEVAARMFKRSGMSDAEARVKAKLFIKVIEEKFAKLSWDDVERLILDCTLDECELAESEQDLDNESEFEDALGL